MNAIVAKTPTEDNQMWTEEFLEKLKEDDSIIYDGKAAHAVKIIPRKNLNPLFEILTEDDGVLSRHGFILDAGCVDGLIKQLHDAKTFWEGEERGR